MRVKPSVATQHELKNWFLGGLHFRKAKDRPPEQLFLPGFDPVDLNKGGAYTLLRMLRTHKSAVGAAIIGTLLTGCAGMPMMRPAEAHTDPPPPVVPTRRVQATTLNLDNIADDAAVFIDDLIELAEPVQQVENENEGEPEVSDRVQLALLDGVPDTVVPGASVQQPAAVQSPPLTKDEQFLVDQVTKLVNNSYSGDWDRCFGHYDGDGDRALTRKELIKLLKDARIGNIATRGTWADRIIQKFDNLPSSIRNMMVDRSEVRHVFGQ